MGALFRYFVLAFILFSVILGKPNVSVFKYGMKVVEYIKRKQDIGLV